MLLKFSGNERKLFFYEKSGGRPAWEIKAAAVGIITGSEGGFSDFEAEMIQKAGGETINLGARILQCELAPVVVLAITLFGAGEL